MALEYDDGRSFSTAPGELREHFVKSGVSFPDDMEAEWLADGYVKLKDVEAATGTSARVKGKRPSAPGQQELGSVLKRRLAASQLNKLQQLKKDTKQE